MDFYASSLATLSAVTAALAFYNYRWPHQQKLSPAQPLFASAKITQARRLQLHFLTTLRFRSCGGLLAGESPREPQVSLLD